ncbi:GumC family protein [Bradyrhizobium prioriisuperbiae]|uniref:GumC family protein n=1 Tax=Bradyrhizobium prioriisuperbiae TaxID=2854389 RepID=UPI0028EE6B90|nr:AAA family ATPase [Bradyrhizobium prioritasuperba]
MSRVTDRQSPAGEVMAPDQILSLIIAFFRRQYPIVLMALVATTLFALGYLLIVRSTYTAQATILMDTRKVQVQSQSLFNDAPMDAPTVESQVEVIKSDNIARSIIEDMKLADDSEFTRYGGGILGNLQYYFFSIFDLFDFSGTTSEEAANRRALGQFTKSLSAKRVGVTYVIEVSFRSAYPERAAKIANAVAEAYINDQLNAKYLAARRASTWLSDRIAELRGQAMSAEKSIADFKAENKIVDAGGRPISEQRVADLSKELAAAKAQTNEARVKLERIDQITKSDLREATVTDALRSEVVTKLRSQYLDMANREADLSSRYGSNHLAAVNLRNQMKEVRRSISEELRRLAETYRSDYSIAQQREKGVQAALDDAVSNSQMTGQAQVRLKELESNSQTYRTIYENFLERYTDTIQQQTYPITEARVISSASRPGRRSSPSTLLVLLVGCVSGLMLGIGIGIINDMADRVIRTRGQAESVLGIDCLSLLPKIADTGVPLVPDQPSGPRSIPRNASIGWSALHDQFSSYAEGIRAIKGAIDLSDRPERARVIGFSSTLQGEGKSTVAASVGLLSAQVGAKAIVVDCDLRHASLTKQLSPSATVGLLQVVTGLTPLEDVIWRDPETGMAFLPAVLNAPMANSNEVLGSTAINELFTKLREQFDYVFVDLPPMMPAIDVRATTHFIQQYVLVMEWGKTRVDAVEEALIATRALKDRLLGVVLNKAETDQLGQYQWHFGALRRLSEKVDSHWVVRDNAS